ncbi:hypothetical protein L2E82_20166 [Cichorium intybus]|uniref:Uncharacterized protein n=1 Tax=Cichorium intybus TaxID=13427 RepID=A0ACB9DSK8_CICIN|nr:hypothetical protein L2E82_20166 [Cichorium intybus]
MEPMLSRYQNNCLHTKEQTTQEAASKDTGIDKKGTKFRTCKELLQSMRRLDEEPIPPLAPSTTTISAIVLMISSSSFISQLQSIGILEQILIEHMKDYVDLLL